MDDLKKNAKKEPQKSSADGDVTGFRFKYIFIILFVLLLLLSLFSQNAVDLSILDGGCDETVSVHNWIGPVGAVTAKWLLYFFGIAAYPLVIFLIVCALRPFMGYPLKRKGYSGSLIAVILGVTMLFAMWPESFVTLTDQLGIGHKDAPESALSGGVIGQFLVGPKSGFITPGLIREYIGTVGASIVGIVFLLTGIVFIWLADWQVVLATFLSHRRQENENRKEQGESDKSSLKVRSMELGPTDKSWLKEKLSRGKKEEAPEPAPEPGETEEEPDFFSRDDHAEAPLPAPPAPQDQKPATPAKSAKLHHSPQVIEKTDYQRPPLPLLEKAEEKQGNSEEFIESSKEILQTTLESFNVNGQVTGTISGPRVTRFEVSLAPGVKVDKVVSIEKNIAMELAAESIRTLAPIPGKNAVGVEIPNSKPTPVFLRPMMETSAWTGSKADIPIVLGKDVAGKPIILDLAKAPHLLIAGATGAGKSVCMNTLIMSLLFKFSPYELKMIMVDPKIVEMKMYENLPHLITPVVNDSSKVPLALRWGVNEMEKRYKILAEVKAKNLRDFNRRPVSDQPVFDDEGDEIPQKLPYLVIIIDELADVMMTDAKSEVETSIARIAQKGRAAGIHIVIATQRPSVNIITGVIKANLPTRIAFRVGSVTDSRVILDQKGADKLLGMGDMLFIPPGASNIDRIQGAFVNDGDIQKVVDFVADQAEQILDDSIVSDEDGGKGDIDNFDWDDDSSEGSVNSVVAKYLEPGDDELVKQALDIIIREQKASTSYLQRRLKIGYNRAAEIIDRFEERGIVSAPLPGGSKRNILITDTMDDE